MEREEIRKFKNKKGGKRRMNNTKKIKRKKVK